MSVAQSGSAKYAKLRRRRWLQFRLRSLLLLTCVCSIVLAVGLPFIESYQHEWQIYRALSRLPRPASVAMAPKAPRWLRPFGAERYMQRIGAVELVDCDDDSLALIAGLPALESLEVRSRRLTDQGLRHIEGCHALVRLVLDGPQITDRGLRSLASVRTLLVLKLTLPLVTDAGLKNLSHLSELRDLEIVAPNVGDDGIRHIAGLALRHLTITASVSDRGLQYLVDQRDLRWSPGQLAERQSIVCIRAGKEPLVGILKETTEADFEDQPLCDVLEYIGQRHGITLSTLADLIKAGIDPTTPITIKTPRVRGRPPLGGCPLYDLLNAILAPVGLDWRMGATTDLEVLPRKTLSPERPNLLNLRAAWPQCAIIVDW